MNRERKIGSLNKIEPAVASVEHIDSKLSENLESNIMYRDNLSFAQRTNIRTLVFEYRDVFTENPIRSKLVTNMHHRIITNEALPVKRKPYRLPHALSSEVDKQIHEVLDNGIIRPSSSP